jgi:hypothetical protein
MSNVEGEEGLLHQLTGRSKGSFAACEAGVVDKPLRRFEKACTVRPRDISMWAVLFRSEAATNNLDRYAESPRATEVGSRKRVKQKVTKNVRSGLSCECAVPATILAM